MSEKRRDNKNRVLRSGESQRKDGRYAFKYTDGNGDTHTVYSWKLEPTDTIPAGKRCVVALRETEAQILKQLKSGIIPPNDLTVLQLVENYIRQKRGVKANTKIGYRTIYRMLQKDPFSQKRIDHVRRSDAKLWLIKLQDEGKSYSTIHTIRGVLKPAFQMAVDDDLLNKNPFDFELATIIVNDSTTREAITEEEKNKFLDFIKNDNYYSRYYDPINILFETGLRVSEFVGLTLRDIDMENRIINVDHQLQRDMTGRLYINTTKTSAGTRKIPMSDSAYESFQGVLAYRRPPAVEPIVDGYSGFLFVDKDGHATVAMHWEHYFQHICAKYNKTHKIQLPKITPHVCRHTYCSIMAKSGMNPKILQYLMGHSDIGVTLNTYTHLHLLDAEEEIRRLDEEKSNPKITKIAKCG